MRRFGVVALVACAVASTAQAGVRATDVATSTTSASATIAWTTTTPSRGRVAFGVGEPALWSAREAAPTTRHSVTLPDLEPATTYAFRVAGSDVAGTVTTAERAATPRFGVDGARITADGSLFFPVFSYEQCADTVDRAVAVGVNTFVQVPYTGCDRPSGRSPPYVLSDDYAAAGGIGWYLPDEPDGWGIPPERMPALPPVQDTGRLRVLNITQHFYSGQAPINDRFDRSDYKRFAAEADVVGFDMYPVVKFCGRVPLSDGFRAQRELMTIYAPGKPTFQWIETSRMTGECATMAITPSIVNAEAWLAVAGGACGLGLFTNSWTGDRWNRWDFDPGVELQLASTVSRLRSLAPALCTDVLPVVVPWNGPVVASARTLNGALYVVAVNGGATPVSVPLRVDGLAGRAVSVLGEGRTLKPAKRVFLRDRFEPYAVHVYVAAPA